MSGKTAWTAYNDGEVADQDLDLAEEHEREAEEAAADQAQNHSATDELLDLLAAVREAIDVPYASCMGEDEKRRAALVDRAMWASLILQHVLDDQTDIAWHTQYLRERLTKVSLDYVTHEESRQRMAAGEDYFTAVMPAGEEADQ